MLYAHIPFLFPVYRSFLNRGYFSGWEGNSFVSYTSNFQVLSFIQAWIDTSGTIKEHGFCPSRYGKIANMKFQWKCQLEKESNGIYLGDCDSWGGKCWIEEVLLSNRAEIVNSSIPTPPLPPIKWEQFGPQNKYELGATWICDSVTFWNRTVGHWEGYSIMLILHFLIKNEDNTYFIVCKNGNNGMGKTSDLFMKFGDTKGTFHAAWTR